MSILIPRKKIRTRKPQNHVLSDSYNTEPVRNLSNFCSDGFIHMFGEGYNSLINDTIITDISAANIVEDQLLNTNLSTGGVIAESTVPGRSQYGAYQSFTSALLIWRFMVIANSTNSVENGGIGAISSALRSPLGAYISPPNWAADRLSATANTSGGKVAVAFSIPKHVWHTLVMSKVGSHVVAALDGELKIITEVATDYWIDSKFHIGRGRSTPNSYLRGYTELAAFLPEVEFTDDAVQSLSENPYQILKPRRKFWVVPSGVAGPAPTGRIMGSSAGSGGLAGIGGIAGRRGGMAG